MATPKCPLCTDLGVEASHRFGNMSCKPELSTKKLAAKKERTIQSEGEKGTPRAETPQRKCTTESVVHMEITEGEGEMN